MPGSIYMDGWVYCDIKHNFIFIDEYYDGNDDWEKTYKCQKCNVIGKEWEDLPGKISTHSSLVNLTCEEIIIKNILE
jgi:hypothetical protein